ncbi:MAG: hypothetical protein WBIAU1_10590 [Wolbachia endosymbiont of Drosophila biauraria]|nr:MAG: hypothetical protein WBIAU1_10590 [Wolbachia endosymbiont of Drosophila biauraria]
MLTIKKSSQGHLTLVRQLKKGNAKNLLIITDYPELIQQYVKNWKARMSQSYKYHTRQVKEIKV